MQNIGLGVQYSAIKGKYDQTSVEDTLKLLIRNKMLFGTRELLFKIFNWVAEYQKYKIQLNEDWQSYTQKKNMVYHDAVKFSYDKCSGLLNELTDLLKQFVKENKILGIKNKFVLKKTEWIRYSDLQKQEIEIKAKVL